MLDYNQQKPQLSRLVGLEWHRFHHRDELQQLDCVSGLPPISLSDELSTLMTLSSRGLLVAPRSRPIFLTTHSLRRLPLNVPGFYFRTLTATYNQA